MLRDITGRENKSGLYLVCYVPGRRRENSGDVNTKSVGSSGSHESSADLDQVQDSETRLKLEIRKV